jgi:mono/diheme cytochrome c family protein
MSGSRPYYELQMSTLAACSTALLLCAVGCHRDMQDQPRYEAFEASTFFEDGQSARPVIAGTVARGQLREDSAYYTAKVDGEVVTELPLELTPELLERGRERYDIFCALCHGAAGAGDGMIVQRGFRKPPSLHIERLRNSRVGHFFDVSTNGFGAMPSYASRVPVRDRWAIVAYIRALQLSQNATLEDVPESERSKLEGTMP